MEVIISSFFCLAFYFCDCGFVRLLVVRNTLITLLVGSFPSERTDARVGNRWPLGKVLYSTLLVLTRSSR